MRTARRLKNRAGRTGTFEQKGARPCNRPTVMNDGGKETRHGLLDVLEMQLPSLKSPTNRRKVFTSPETCLEVHL
jgi:hypothetical protein